MICGRYFVKRRDVTLNPLRPFLIRALSRAHPKAGIGLELMVTKIKKAPKSICPGGACR